MTATWAIFALIVPWAAGVALVRLLGMPRTLGTRHGAPNVLLAIGAGWFVGQAMMMAALYVSLLAFGSGHARSILAGMALLAIGLLGATRYRIRGPGAEDWSDPSQVAADVSPQLRRRWPAVVRRVILAIIAASLLAKLYLLICSHAFLPIRNDDAISIWLFKAKVITSLDRLPLDPTSEYYLGGSNPHYSVFVPLAAAWLPMVTGQWHEQLATLPWLFYYINLILLIAGGLRRWLTSAQSWIAAYVVASLPLMVVHVYRPGYADTILAAFLAAAVTYLLIW